MRGHVYDYGACMGVQMVFVCQHCDGEVASQIIVGT